MYNFHPANSLSACSEATLRAFIDGELQADLVTVPGLGPASVTRLATHNVHNTYQLIGVYLALKGKVGTKTVAMKDHLEKFYDFVVALGCKTHHATAVCVAIAAKVNVLIPGLYDPAEWD